MLKFFYIEELDFRVEASNTEFFREHCIVDEEKISCPKIIDELTTSKILTMTFVACILFIGSCILATVDLTPKTSTGIPLISMIGIIFSIALAIYSVNKLTKK